MNDAAADGLPPLRDVIRTYDLAAKKSLGQNFILDLNLTRRIARLAAPLADKTVVEVGPGPGGLTRALLMEGAGRVLAVERDGRCLAALADISRAYPDRLDVRHGDALDVDWGNELASAANVAIVANLPYSVATALLIGWLEVEPWPPWWTMMALMFQKEVAERIVATPGSKAYGRLAVIAQTRTRPEIAMTLGPQAFTPPPKVASAVVVFEPRALSEQPLCKISTLGKVTASAFGQRRKMLRQSLKTLTPFPELLLNEAGLDPTLRAEALTVAEFATLAVIYERILATPTG